MRKEYKEELNALRLKMQKAEAFAEKLPVFADYILQHKLTGDEPHIKLSTQYKNTPLHWGVCRNHYRNGSSVSICNAPAEMVYNLPLHNIYINTISLFNTHEKFSLDSAFSGVEVFFADWINTTFYVEDKHIAAFLEALNKWYLAAESKVTAYRAEKKKADLLAQLAALDKTTQQPKDTE